MIRPFTTVFRGKNKAMRHSIGIALLMTFGVGLSPHLFAQTTTARTFPSNAQLGVLKASYWPDQPELVIGKQPLRTAPGFLARGVSNESLSRFPDSASGKPYAIAWTPDTMGQVLRVWVLRPVEISNFLSRSASAASAASAVSVTSASSTSN